MEIFILLLLLIDQPMCPNGIRIVETRCYTPCTYAKNTLDSVPELVIDFYVQSLQLLFPKIPHLIPLRHTSPPSLSAAAAATSLNPSRLSHACSHHRIPTCTHSVFYNPSHRSNSDRLVMYCATVFWCCLMYSSIVKNHASSLAVADEVYIRFLPGVQCGSRTVRCLSTWA